MLGDQRGETKRIYCVKALILWSGKNIVPKKEKKITRIQEAVAELEEGLATYFTILKALILGHGQEAVAELEEGLATLLEMFPHCCRVEAAHCLTLVFPSKSNIKIVRSKVNAIQVLRFCLNLQRQLHGSYFS